MNIFDLARHGLNGFEQIAVWCVMAVAFISLGYAWLLRGVVMKKDKGTPKMIEVWDAIRVGADSYLNRQLKTILTGCRFIDYRHVLERFCCCAHERSDERIWRR